MLIHREDKTASLAILLSDLNMALKAIGSHLWLVRGLSFELNYAGKRSPQAYRRFT